MKTSITRRGFCATTVGAVVGLAWRENACAQTELPKGIVTLVVPFAAGGATDVISRHVARSVSKQIGQSIVIENVAGLALA